MGDVIVFSAPTAPDPSSFFRHLDASDIPRGKCPYGHPVPKRTTDGVVLIELGQVWVERPHRKLWIVTEIHKAYPRRIFFKSYGGKMTRVMLERVFRTNMEIWDDHRAYIYCLFENRDNIEVIDICLKQP